jgi:MFS family permease
MLINQMRSEPREYTTVLSFTASIFTFVTINWMIGSFLPVYMKKVGLTDGEIGTVLGLISISGLALMLPLGVLSDLVSPRRLVLMGGVVFLIYAAGILSVREYWQFLLVAPLGGISGASFFIVLFALFLKTMGNGNMGKKIALYQCGMYLGFGVGPAIAGPLVRKGSFEPLLFGALVGSVLLLGLILRLPDYPGIRLDLGGYRRDLRQSRTLLFLLLALVYATHFGAEQTSFTLLMKENLGFSTPSIGLVYLAIGCWMAMLAPFAGHRFDARQSIRAFLLAGLIINGTFQIITPTVSSFLGMVLVRVAHTTGDVLLILSMGLMTAAFFPEVRMGGNSAVVFATRTCGVFAGNVGSGYINGAFGYPISFVASGGFILLFVLLAGAAVSRRLVVNSNLEPAEDQQQSNTRRTINS